MESRDYDKDSFL